MQEEGRMPEGNENTKKTEELLIVPPGLRKSVREFEAHFRSASREPVMIVGETGVGKKLFLRMAKRLYFEGCRQKGNTTPHYAEANCSHFGGRQSDPNLARSELFGVDKSFAPLLRKTEARKGPTKEEDILGFIDKANGGLLILEEIGELPREVQAMLLTFIETGEYRRVGGSELLKADVQIVGATNREEALRPDFRYRFFPFYVPPIHERREDAYSGPFRPLIPIDSGRAFRSIPATYSGAFRPPPQG